MLKELFKRKKAVSEKVDVQLINDCNRILGVIRSSNTVSAITTKEIIYRLGMMESLPYNRVTGTFRGGNLEKRVLNALLELKKRGFVGFGGKLGDMVCYTRSNLPSIIG
jgi:hypothetical protein